MSIAQAPRYAPDIFSDEALLDPAPHWRRLQELGPVVWLEATGVHAVTRHADVRAVLADHGTFCSGEGVMFTDVANRLTAGTLLASDPPLHHRLRRILAHRMLPRALGDQQPRIDALAAGAVDRAVARAVTGAVVDGVPELAEAVPCAFVPEFLGFPPDSHDRLLPWADAAIEAGGPASARSPAAGALAGELGAYAEALVAERRVLPGSLAEDLLAAADRGEIDGGRAVALLLDYFGPSLETTISALASALWLFAEHPDQWALLRADPALVGGAFQEVVRLETPLRAFTRVATVDTEISGTPVAAGTRLAVFYAAANRDPSAFPDPESFDITRDNVAHVGLGHGVHACVGQGLARLEVAAVLTALADRVERLELAAPPVRRINSLLQGWASLPLRLVPARASA